MKLSLKNRIERYVKAQYPTWVSGLVIEELCRGAVDRNGEFYKGESGDRRARELVREKILESTKIKGYVEFRAHHPNSATEDKGVPHSQGHREVRSQQAEVSSLPEQPSLFSATA